VIRRRDPDIEIPIPMLRDLVTAPLSLGATVPDEADPVAVRTTEPGDVARRLAENHYREVWSVLRRLGVYDGLDDATQHVFLIAAQRRDAIRVESERAFVVSVAIRTAANWRRSRAAHRARHVESDVLDVPSVAPLADELLEQRRLRSLLDEALDSLAPDLRAAFVLFELEDMTHEEIAEALGIPRGTVASRLRRAREQFQAAARRLKARAGRGEAP